MRKMTATLLMALALATWCGGGFAGTIYDNGAPNQSYAYYSDVDSDYQAADNFSLSAGASTIRDIHWWGVYAWANKPLQEDDFTIEIFQDCAGLPGAAVFSQNIGAANRQLTTMVGQGDGLSIYSYSICVDPIQLAPNTTYWLSVLNDTTGDSNEWAWSVSSFAYHGHAHRCEWTHSDDNLAFYLTDDCVPPVPEPSSMALLGFGVLGFVARRRLLTRR